MARALRAAVPALRVLPPLPPPMARVPLPALDARAVAADAAAMVEPAARTAFGWAMLLGQIRAAEELRAAGAPPAALLDALLLNLRGLDRAMAAASEPGTRIPTTKEA